VFIGYPFGQKGYKYFHIETNKIFVSRYVTFDDTFFHTNTNLHNPMIHLYPLITSYGCHHLSCRPSPFPCMYLLYQLYHTNSLLPQSLLLYLLLPLCNLFLLIILHHLHNHHIYPVNNFLMLLPPLLLLPTTPPHPHT
jgi:hypothetical protein